MTDWIDSFSNYFNVIKADTPVLVKQAKRLRYQIYCLERNYEDSDVCENHLEQDDLDDESAHGLLIFVPRNEPVGTVRLILPNKSNQNRLFPIEEHSEFTSTNHEFHQGHSILELISRRQIAEVSRFSISKSFRKRLGEDKTSHGLVYTKQALVKLNDRRFIPHLTVGLVKSMFQLSNENRITHWFALMEPALRKSLLRRFYLQFHPLGPTVNYRGIRQPYIADIASTAEEIRKNDMPMWSLLTNNGEYLS